MAWFNVFSSNMFQNVNQAVQAANQAANQAAAAAAAAQATETAKRAAVTASAKAGNIQIRPDELIKAADLCYQGGKTLDGLLDNVHVIMSEFLNSDVFEGQQAAGVRDSYNKTRENLDKFPQMVAWLGAKLEQSAYAFMEADKDNVTLYAESVFASTILTLLPATMQDGFFNKLNNDPAFMDTVLKQLEQKTKEGATFATDNPEKIAAAGKAIKALKTLYDINKGTNTVIGTTAAGTTGLVTGAGKAASKFAKGMAAAGAIVTVGISIYDAFTGADQSPEMIAAQISSGLVQAAMGFTGVGAVVLATDAIIQFVGPVVAGVMRDNASWLAGGGIKAEDIVASANKFDQAVQDISLDKRLDGTFNALYKGDILGVAGEVSTLTHGLVDVVDQGINLAGYAAGGLINKLIPGAGGPVSAAIINAGLVATNMITAPLRAFNFAADLFTGKAKLGDLVAGPGNFIGNTLDTIGLKGAGDWVRSVNSTISSGINSAVDTAVKFAEQAWQSAQKAIADAAAAAARAAEAAAKAVADAAVAAANAVARAAQDAANAVANAATTVVNAIADPC